MSFDSVSMCFLLLSFLQIILQFTARDPLAPYSKYKNKYKITFSQIIACNDFSLDCFIFFFFVDASLTVKP